METITNHKNREDLFIEFQREMECNDEREAMCSKVFNTPEGPTSLSSRFRRHRLAIQLAFICDIIVSYTPEINTWNTDSEGKEKEKENEMYQELKRWGDEGYLPKDFVDLASELQNDARPVRSIAGHMFQMVLHLLELATGAKFIWIDPDQQIRDRADVAGRIINLLEKVLSERLKISKHHDNTVDADTQELLDVYPNSDFAQDSIRERDDDLKSLQAEGVDPTIPLPPPDSATLDRERNERQKRMEAYVRKYGRTQHLGLMSKNGCRDMGMDVEGGVACVEVDILSDRG